MPTATNLASILDGTSPSDRPFIINVKPDESEVAVTYGQARHAVPRIGALLRARGLNPGDAVAIVAANSADFMLAYFGIMWAGLVAVPVNYRTSLETLRHVLRDSGVRFALVDADCASLVPADIPTAMLGEGEMVAVDASPIPIEPTAPEDVAMVLYTSGSSGLPKGVPLTHGGYLWATKQYENMREAVLEGPAIVAAPLFHMNALFFSKLLARFGGTNVLMRKFTPGGYIRAISRNRVAVLTAVPTMLALVAREKAALAEADLASVRLIVSSSAPSTEGLLEEIRRLFPNAAVANGWGTTEAGPVAFGPHPDGRQPPILSLGYPRGNIEWRLEGGSDENEGVFHIRTPAQMSGYLNLEGETTRRIADGWYNTGDVMRRDKDGFFFFVGRADDMFVCAGENIYPGEVERLIEQHPSVAQAAVVPVEDEIKHALPVAFVVPKSGEAPTEADIKAFALANGPAYAHPRAIWLMPELPLAGTNKIDRKALMRIADARFARPVAK